MGTAASFAPVQRLPYDDNGRNAQDYGDEGLNLDPPWVDVANGEMAGFDSSPQLRTAIDPRHRGRGAIMWVDGHATTETLEALGYRTRPDGSIDFLGENVLWSGTGRDVPWTNDYRP